ncbi:B5 isoform [Seminavis robusta]|uniref:B5 isoform n=1 Tax=Seminavis robusta TaxID=568900 RepID=A0A9N8H1X4_9STRA|nr:B5 isoform [Seminavis robusta]|eukprot:Sro1_g000540.1 B5 isoform (71) ;mRNA; r:157480-158009
MFFSSWKLFSVTVLLAGRADGQYSASDVQSHSSSGDCWTVVDSKVYDVTSYAGSHPGGSGVVHGMCGKDG